jgi:hypothetical protein
MLGIKGLLIRSSVRRPLSTTLKSVPGRGLINDATSAGLFLRTRQGSRKLCSFRSQVTKWTALAMPRCTLPDQEESSRLVFSRF